MKTMHLLPLVLAALALLGSTCQPGSGQPPALSLTLNGIESPLNTLLVVPRSGFVVNLSLTPGASPVVPGSLQATAQRWGSQSVVPLEALFQAAPSGAVALIPPGLLVETGTYTITALIADEAGRVGAGSFSFAVRNPAGGGAPIGTGQQIWLDFEPDRDATPGPDFPIDLRSFGLGSAAAPAVSELARQAVIDAVLARVRQAYYDEDPSGLGDDPVAVDFVDQPPAGGDVTRICVGGEDPSGGATIGSIQLDPNNSARSSVECGTIPPTGIFPRELLVFQSQTYFKNVFDPLRSEAGGTPVGGSPWDGVVLDPGFDPGSAPAEALARHAVVWAGIQAFGNVLGSIVAHEAGHALGLVPPGPPGIGLYGGSDGASYIHSVNPDGSAPYDNFLMKAGNTFNFAKLAGLGSYGLPRFRSIEHAYLRDRVVLATQVTQLLPPPVLSEIQPIVLPGPSQIMRVYGQHFAAIPAIRLRNAAYTYSALGEAFISGTEATCWVVNSQLPPGIYDVELTNPDGQVVVRPTSVLVF
jgi:hypothetical protein